MTQINTPVLDMYYSFCENGIPGNNGLCNHFDGQSPFAQEFSLFIPSRWEPDYPGAWWANEDNTRGMFDQSEMTPLRQNIVLFIAAMRGEL